MDADGVKRKLTAMLSADVEGYSRLMAMLSTEKFHAIAHVRAKAPFPISS